MAGLLPNLRPVVNDQGQFLGDPRVLELLAKDPRFAELADQWVKSQTSGGDGPSAYNPDFSVLKGYTYGTTAADNRLPGDNDPRGSMSQHALYDPSGNLVSDMDYKSEGAGMSALKGVGAVLAAAYGLPQLYSAMGGTAGAAGAAEGIGALEGLTPIEYGMGAADYSIGLPSFAEGAANVGLADFTPSFLGLPVAPTPDFLKPFAPTAPSGSGNYVSPGQMDQDLANETVKSGGMPGANAILPGKDGGGLFGGLPKTLTDLLTSPLGATLIGGLLGNALKPDAPSGGTRNLGPDPVLRPRTPFKMPTWDRTSQGLPGGLGNKSAGLFDQYMRDLLAPRG